MVISTDFGDITVKLYDETPKHRDNFVKLAKHGFYDGLLIHSVIKGHFIQSGAPESKEASKNRQIGVNNIIGYTIPEEIVYPKYFNKKGALGAVRSGSDGNLQKESSGSLFYIVLGSVYTNEELDEIEKEENEKRLNRIIESLFLKHQDELSLLMRNNDTEKLTNLQDELIAQARVEFDQKQAFKFTTEQREAYTSIGGNPQMDNEYTVFGEIVEGLYVLDQIAEVQTGLNNRPVKDIRINVQIK